MTINLFEVCEKSIYKYFVGANKCHNFKWYYRFMTMTQNVSKITYQRVKIFHLGKPRDKMCPFVSNIIISSILCIYFLNLINSIPTVLFYPFMWEVPGGPVRIVPIFILNYTMLKLKYVLHLNSLYLLTLTLYVFKF